MNSLSSQIFTPLRSLHSVSQPIAQEKSTVFSTPTPSQDARTRGDYYVSLEYVSALRRVLDGGAKSETTLRIDPESTFGQWWSQLERAFESPDVFQWIRDKGINKESIKLNPGSGQLSYSLKYALDPKQTIHTVGLGDRLWASISGPILAAARVISAGNPNVTFAPPTNSFNPAPAPYQLVGQFYNEQPDQTESAMRNREQELGRNKGFTPLDPTTSAGLIEARSESELQAQQANLGDSHNRYQIIQALQTLLFDLDQGKITAQQIPNALMQRVVHLAPASTYQVPATGVLQQASLLQLLKDHGWDIPTNHKELANLATTLWAPALNPPVNGNLGGTLSWPLPLDRDSQVQLTADIRAGRFGNLTLSPFGTVLEYLLNARPITPQEQRAPRQLIDELVNSPRGKALGQAIQDSFTARGVKGSARDWLLAALSVTGASGTGGQAGRATPGVIEGFRLVSVATMNKSPSAIVQALADHLVASGKVSSAETAAVQAHLLLASQAPEFLVGGIPDQVGVSTHSWVSFATSVARIEAKAPGATATMSYAQIMLEAENAPITEEDREVEFCAQNEAIRAWAAVNGLGYPATPGTMAEARTAFTAQVNELREASETPVGEMPTTERVALEQLKTAFPDMDPALFSKKIISLQPSNRHFPGPYSCLDLYIDGRALRGSPDSADNWGAAGRGLLAFATLGQVKIAADGKPTKWNASSSEINVDHFLTKLKDLPRPETIFNDAFRDYRAAVKKVTGAHIKFLMSKLPQQDQENLAYAKVTVRKGVIYYRTNQYKPAADGVLLVETERNGKVVMYEFDRLKGVITRLADKPHLHHGETLLFNLTPEVIYNKVSPQGEYPPGLTDEKKGATGAVNSFSSARTQYIVDSLIEDMNFPAVETYAKGQTTFDTEVPAHKVAAKIGLSLIPFYSAIDNFKSGNIGGGLADLAFDILGFTVGLGAAARGAKALAVGASALSKIGRVGKIVGRAAIGAINPLDGLSDVARGAANLGRKGISASHQGVQHLRGAYRNVNLLELANRPDIAQGTYKGAERASSSKVIAQFDTTTQQWHAYDPRTQLAYGKALTDFSADIPTLNDPNSLGTVKKGLLGLGNQSNPTANTGAQKPYYEQLRQNIESARMPGELRDFNQGFKSGKLENIPGYRSDMDTLALIKLASDSDLASDEIGALAREIKESLIRDAKRFSIALFNDVNGPGVKVTPASQMHFLAHVDITSKGECAGLANLTALAMEQNKQDRLMQNLYRSLTNPTEPQSAAFIQTLKDLQDRLGRKFSFHMGKPQTKMNYQAIIDDLTNSPTSKTLRLGTKDHGLTAGIKVEPGSTTWFFYDPNGGLVEFKTLESMQKGLEKALNSGRVGESLNTYGSKRGTREFYVSEFAQSDLNTVDKADMQRLLDTAL